MQTWYNGINIYQRLTLWAAVIIASLATAFIASPLVAVLAYFEFGRFNK
jgi:hypothetical protein